MRVVVAPDAFKESLPAEAVAAAISRGIRDVAPRATTEEVPLADGGEGTLAALRRAVPEAREREATVTGPLGSPVRARLLELPRGEILVEAAEACGLEQIPGHQRDPATTTSRGVGELIRTALDLQARRIIVGVGGSGTVDGGASALGALGARVTGKDGEAIATGGAALARVARVDLTGLDPRLAGVDVVVATDVENPLAGPEGAAVVFGPQKGADRELVDRLDRALAAYGRHLEAAAGRTIASAPGAGAAGGLGAALLALPRARRASGATVIADAAGLPARIPGADLVITGEGRLDATSMRGKVVGHVVAAARAARVPVVVLAGQIGIDAPPDVAALVIGRGLRDREEALAETGEALTRTARTLVRILQAGGGLFLDDGEVES